MFYCRHWTQMDTTQHRNAETAIGRLQNKNIILYIIILACDRIFGMRKRMSDSFLKIHNFANCLVEMLT